MPPVQTLLDVTLLALVTAAAVMDLARRRIPNYLLLTGWVLALPLHGLGPQPGAALLSACAGALCGLVLFLPLYLVRGMAAGDVKMLATVGLFVGPTEIVHVALLTCCAGGLMAAAMIIGTGRVRRACSNVADLVRPLWMRARGIPAVVEPMRQASVGNMPYGLAIAVATMGSLYMRHV